MVVHVVSSVQVQTKQVTEKDQGWQLFFFGFGHSKFLQNFMQGWLDPRCKFMYISPS
jgi:hypothetical protein